MYCTNCGHPILNTDRFCGYCGSPISQEAESAGQPVQEEVIYNEPSGSVPEADSSHYPREISLVFEEKDENPPIQSGAVPEEIFCEKESPIAENQSGQKEQNERKEESHTQEFEGESKPECHCDFSEFSWNVQDFPKPQKIDPVPIRWGASSESTQAKERTVDEPFVWNLGDMAAGKSGEASEKEPAGQRVTPSSAPDPHIQTVPNAGGAAVHQLSEEEADRIRRLEEEIFAEAKASKSVKVSDTVHMGSDADEVFFTFSKKNEEFQKLLDREYDKVQKRMREDQIKDQQGVSEKIELFGNEQSRGLSQPAPETARPVQPEVPISQARPQSQPEVPRSELKSELSGAQPEVLHSFTAKPQSQPDVPRSAAKSETTRKTKPISRDEVKEAVKKYILNLEGEEMPSVSVQPSVEDRRSCQPESMPPSEPAVSSKRQQAAPLFSSDQKPAVSITLEQASPGSTVPDHITSGQMSDRILPQEVLAARKTLHDFNLMQEMEAGSEGFHEMGGEAQQQAQPQVKRPVGYVNPQADEMVKARAGFFGSTASLDYVQLEQEELQERRSAASAQTSSEGSEKTEAEAPQAGEPYDPTAAPGSFYYEGPQSTKRKKRLRIIKWTALIVVAVLVIFEGTILGIKYFAPQSAAALMIERAEQSVLGIFHSNEAQPIPDSDQSMNQTAEMPQNPPTATMDELIQQQIGNNYNNNIVKVEANPDLKYDPQKDYGVEDVNNSLPISDNFWLESNGVRYNYDATVVGTVIAYCSKWMSFVNEGDESVFSMLASGGAADQRAKEYKPEKGVHETMTSLQLGEIRRGANGFYIWTKEEITIDRGGQSEQKQQSYIYYMAPNGRSFQVIDYYPY